MKPPVPRSRARTSAPAAAVAPPAHASDAPRLPWALALFALALAVYARTLYRTVPGGDSGELILVAQRLGVAHPPGYPLFTLLGKLFSLIPVATPAWRVNLLSATCDAGAAAFLLLAVARWTGSVWAGVLGAGLFAFSPLTWTDATGAEVFALNNLFCAGLVYLLVRYFQKPDERVARVGALWCGLGLSNHHLFLVFALPAVAAVLWRGRRALLAPRSFAILAGLFAAGLLPYLYLPWASSRRPAYAWADQTTLDGFLRHLLRRDYGTFDLAAGDAAGSSTFAQRLAAWLGQIPGELGAGLPLAAWGLWSALRAPRGRAVQVLLATLLVAYLALFLGRANLPLTYPLQRGIQSRFWMQANLLLFVWAGVGLGALGARLPERLRPVARVALPGIAVAAVLAQLAVHFRAQDHSRTTAVRDFARAVLETVPPNTLLLSSGDYLTHSLRYLQEEDGVRPDVRVIDHVLLQSPDEVRRVARWVPDVRLPGTRLSPLPGGGGFDLARLFDANAARRPIFVANGIRVPDSSWERDWVSQPVGLVQWMLPKARELDLDTWTRRDAEALARFTPPRAGAVPVESWEHEVLRQFWFARYVHGTMLLNYASRHDSDPRAARRAARTLESVRDAGVFAQPELYRNLGGAYWVLSASDSTARDPMRRAFDRYLELSPRAADRADIEAMKREGPAPSASGPAASRAVP